MSLVIDDVLIRHDPVGEPVPVVLDSPHSGTKYPPEFDFICPLALLRQAEDTHVDELFGLAPDHGAALLCALFPRSFLDVNRAEDDIDPALLADPFPGRLNPSEKSRLGMGLVRTLCRPGMPMYDGKLTSAQVAARIERYWRPYHEELAGMISRVRDRFGVVWHLDCHSMPCLSGPGDWPEHRVDFVLGDRDGTTCDPHFTRFVAEQLRSMGYRVKLNDPYKGVELVRRYSNPAEGMHSLQVEVCRRLYMDEETLEKHDGFEPLRRNLTELVRRIGIYARERVLSRAAAE
ncbi:N-formylglutamate amidohydrolase [Indioceanicola profundi]|uniref:N-formylglutamate amidohydrolase n=1 Tax=Indioceanicola profundi TaxID=2220096 RepID=UPI000E6AB242|nr:N-formylglutamate amidohydrolase [Indioceanicola profundi]